MLLSNGTWQNISTSVRRDGGVGINIKRGRNDERGRTTMTGSLSLEDPDGDFNDLNPLSPYYGLIGPNTQLRISLGNSAATEDDFNRNVTNGITAGVLDLPGGSGNYVSSPDAAALDIVGDIDIRARIAPDDWTPSADQCIISKSNTSGNQRSYQFIIQSPGNLRFSWSTDGTGANTRNVDSTVSTGFTNGEAHWVRVTLDVDNGSTQHVVTFYTSENGTSWTQLGATVTTAGVTSIFSSTATANVGARSAGTADLYAGLIYRAEIRSSIGGTVVADPRFDQQGAGNTSFTDSTGKVWTLNGTAALVNDPDAIAWTLNGGTNPGEYDVNGTHATHTHGTANVIHRSYTSIGEVNHRVRQTVNLSAADVTGGAVTYFLVGRMTDTSNYYTAALTYTAAEVVTLTLNKLVAGVLTQLGSAVTVGTFTGAATTPITVELYVEGSKIHARAWTTTEPGAWQIAERDTALTTGTLAGMVSKRESTNTNASLEFRFNDFLAVPGTIRGHFEVPNFGASRWTPGGTDVTMALQLAGIKRRLGSPGAEALQSAMYRYIVRSDQSQLVGYWPCEGGSFTGQIGSGIGGSPLVVSGAGATFGTTSPFPGSASMVTLATGSQLTCATLNSTDTGQVRGQMLVALDLGVADDTPLMEIAQVKDPDVRKWRLEFSTINGGSLRIRGFAHNGSVTETGAYVDFNCSGETMMAHFQLEQNGADVDWFIGVQRLEADGTRLGFFGNGTFSGSSVGAPTSVTIAPTGAMASCQVSHVVVCNNFDALDGSEEAMVGHRFESAAERFARLCDEEGVAYQVYGHTGRGSSVRMGPQRIATLLANLEDCEDADHGILYEARHFFGLVYRTHESLLGQTGPEFSYTDGYLTGEPFPDPDDQLVGNDVTATLPRGSEYRSIEETGAMSVQNPPNGIGRYVRPVRANVANESQLADIARWNRHVGTWRNARYPSIRFDTHRVQFTAAKSAEVDALDHGDYFTIPDTPAWLEPGPIEQLAQGYNERIENLTHGITFNCRPAGPYFVAVRGTEEWWRDSLASTLSSGAASGATSLSVAVVGPLWRTGATDFNIMVSGSVKRVTNISGASSPQTFTVDASAVNGIDKALASGAEVHVHPRPVRALTDVEFNTTTKEDVDETRVCGLDTPPAVWVEGESTGNFTNSTYSEDAQPIGVVFTVPSTGSFAIHLAGQMAIDTGTGFALMSWVIRSGTVLGQGQVLQGATDANSILLLNTNDMRISKTFLFDDVTTLIQPGDVINVTMAHRRDTAGTASITRRLLLVRPAKIQGGLPGSLIEFEPAPEDDVQDATDTSVSTTYTTADMTPCGTAFVAPRSGKVLIHIAARIDNSGANSTFVSFAVRQGNVVGSGTSVLAASDTRALENNNVNQIMGGCAFLVTGLTAAADYNVQLEHRVTAGTGTLDNRLVTVEPVA